MNMTGDGSSMGIWGDLIRQWDEEVAPDLEQARRLWDLRAEEFASRGRTNGNKDDVKAFLVGKQEYNQQSNILDIGCGAGKLSALLSYSGAKVMGVDLSPAMIKYAKESGQELDNPPEFQVLAWEEADLEKLGWQGKFDLVIASMCPAIHDQATLKKMCQASRGACFFSSFAERESELRNMLEAEIQGGTGENTWKKRLMYIMNTLWLWGYYPEIVYRDSEWEHSWTVEQAMEFYAWQLDREGKKKEQIRKLLVTKAAEGRIRDYTRAKAAWIYWRV